MPDSKGGRHSSRVEENSGDDDWNEAQLFMQTCRRDAYQSVSLLVDGS